MLDDQPLTIDWTVQNTLLQILPRPPLLSSHEQGWNGINVECHCQPAHETPEHSHTQHVLAIVSKCNLLKAERKLDEHFYSSCMDIGGIFLIPANVHHQVWMHGEAEYIVLSLKPELITRAAYESIDKDCVEIVPQHHIHDSLIYSIGLALLSELESDGVCNRLYAESAASLLAVHLLQRYSTQKPTIRKYKDGLTKTRLQQAVEYINDHLGEDLSLKEIANQVSMSQYHFSRLFKQSTGLTPWQYVVQIRLKTAKQLLAMQKLSMAEISERLGFANQQQFTTFFRKHMGATPTAYRQLL
jgi:AraC family transcriptional regulator